MASSHSETIFVVRASVPIVALYLVNFSVLEDELVWVASASLV